MQIIRLCNEIVTTMESNNVLLSYFLCRFWLWHLPREYAVKLAMDIVVHHSEVDTAVMVAVMAAVSAASVDQVGS